MGAKLLISFLLFLSLVANAQVTQLKNEENNCRKVNGYGVNDRMAIAMKYKVPLSSVKFIGARWDWSDNLRFTKTCVFVFDTAAGPKRCFSALSLYSDDNGKTAFGIITSPYGGHPMCD